VPRATVSVAIARLSDEVILSVKKTRSSATAKKQVQTTRQLRMSTTYAG